MNKFFGVSLFIVSFFLVIWSALSTTGFIINFSSNTSSYGAGLIAGKAVATIIFGYLGYRAFKASKKKFMMQTKS